MDWSSNSEFYLLTFINTNQFLRYKFRPTNNDIDAEYEISFDQGQTWESCLSLTFENVRMREFNENYALAIGDRRYFKFIKFPD